jgi:hypothetical protein
MRCVFAGSGDPIVTAAARAGGTTVVEDGAKPCGGIVTTAAFGGGWQVCRMFACRPYTVMTAAAPAGYAGVIKAGAKPRIGRMANITLLSCLWMRRMFTRSGDSVMAAAAGAYHRAMIDSANTGEAERVMTVFTAGDHGDMCRRQAECHRVIMAGFAGCKDAAMVKSCASPGFCGVTVIAQIAADDMLCVLTWCAAVVMAQYTLHRCALELTAYVTAGTIDKLMFAC